MRKSRTIRGMTLVETLMAASLTVLVLLTSVSTFMFTMQSWATGAGAIGAQSTSQNAVRTISMQLREALVFNVDGDGMGITYRLPLTDGDGDYVLPVTWDGVTRTIRLQADNTILMSDGTDTRTLCRNVITTDPDSPGGTTPYQIFVAGAGTVKRSLTITVAARKAGFTDGTVTSRSREIVYLRNIPELSR